MRHVWHLSKLDKSTVELPILPFDDAAPWHLTTEVGRRSLRAVGPGCQVAPTVAGVGVTALAAAIAASVGGVDPCIPVAARWLPCQPAKQTKVAC